MTPTACPICDSLLLTSAFKAKREKSNQTEYSMKASGSDSRGRNIYFCKDCTVYFCHPLPNQVDLFTSYDQFNDGEFVSQNIYRYKTFKTQFMKFINQSNLVISKIFVTDIGAASGVFLKMVMDSGGTGRGFEANKWLVTQGVENFGVDISQGSIRNFVSTEELLDVVTLWDVLEHLSEPRTDLMYLSSRLKSKSIVLVTLPSTDSKSFKWLGWRWPMHLDVHLFYFNKKSLNSLFQSCGFKLMYESKYPQKLSLGYLLFRVLKIVFSEVDESRINYLTRGFLNLIPIKYSVGQRVFAFEKS